MGESFAQGSHFFRGTASHSQGPPRSRHFSSDSNRSGREMEDTNLGAPFLLRWNPPKKKLVGDQSGCSLGGQKGTPACSLGSGTLQKWRIPFNTPQTSGISSCLSESDVAFDPAELLDHLQALGMALVLDGAHVRVRVDEVLRHLANPPRGRLVGYECVATLHAGSDNIGNPALQGQPKRWIKMTNGIPIITFYGTRYPQNVGFSSNQPNNSKVYTALPQTFRLLGVLLGFPSQKHQPDCV